MKKMFLVAMAMTTILTHSAYAVDEDGVTTTDGKAIDHILIRLLNAVYSRSQAIAQIDKIFNSFPHSETVETPKSYDDLNSKTIGGKTEITGENCYLNIAKVSKEYLETAPFNPDYMVSFWTTDPKGNKVNEFKINTEDARTEILQTPRTKVSLPSLVFSPPPKPDLSSAIGIKTPWDVTSNKITVVFNEEHKVTQVRTSITFTYSHGHYDPTKNYKTAEKTIDCIFR
ncbi:MAG: hypothetical protein K1X29_07970 [Bdellovibrionales bacterium]|nr:hypothetical protein [Bdellovibrionales bacterium]